MLNHYFFTMCTAIVIYTKCYESEAFPLFSNSYMHFSLERYLTACVEVFIYSDTSQNTVPSSIFVNHQALARVFLILGTG